MDHLVGQLERVRWKMPDSRQFASEERWGPMAVFPAPRPTGEPPGPGRGPMQLADAVGWLCLIGCWRNGAEGGRMSLSTELSWPLLCFASAQPWGRTKSKIRLRERITNGSGDALSKPES